METEPNDEEGEMDLELNSTAERRAVAAQSLGAFASLSLRHVRSQVAEALQHFGRLGILEEYTKHDISHIDGMLAMYDWMIPDATAERMTPADWLLITLSTYLHDFGLLVTRDEFGRRDELPGYVSFSRRVRDNDDPEFTDYRAQLDQMNSIRADEFLYQEFVRANHAQRIRNWLREVPDSSLGGDDRVMKSLYAIFGGIEETFLEDLGLVCESHHADDLANTKKYPINKPYGPTREEEANVQFAAFLLRTADLLHITKERVPSMAALVINPRNPKSQTEWAKQASVRSVRPKFVEADPSDSSAKPQSDTIEVHATFKEAEGFFGVTQYLKYAGRQLAQTQVWSSVSEGNGASEYVFPWRRIDTTHIEAKGFVAQPFEFSIDQGKILDLLTGHTLYNDSGVVVRELVQNALDAVRLESEIDSKSVPRIEVTWDAAQRVLEVRDNGVGMSQSVIEQNFLRVGSSRYQEAEFKKSYPHFASISRFGIGVLSAFMVADDVSVVTSSQSENEARQLSLRDVHGQYLVRLLDKSSSDVPEMIRDHGTSVRLKLRPSADLVDVEKMLRYWIIIPDCDISISVNAQPATTVGFETLTDALRESLVAAELVRVGDGKLLTAYGYEVEIRERDFDGCNVAYAVSWNRWLQEWQYVRIDQNGDSNQPKAVFGTSIGGVRVTESAPGFVRGGVAAMANFRGEHAPRTNVARSAIERTDEYDRFLKQVYRTYVDHISAEMSEYEGSRAGSATRAALEGSLMVNDLARRPDVDSESLLKGEIRSIPLLLIEDGENRSRKSLTDLESYDLLWSVEGAAVSSFESVLSSIRGTTSVSLRRLVDALGDDGGLQLPDSALVCGRLSSHMYSNQLFTGEWEPVRFEADKESRVLSTAWRRVGDEARWQTSGLPKNLPGTLFQRLHSDARGGSSSGLMHFPTGEGIETTGIAAKIVTSHGKHFLLPGNEFLTVPAANEGVPETDRLWAVAWIVQNIIVGDEDRRFNTRSMHNDANRRDTAWRTGVIETLRELRLFDVVDEASIAAAFASASIDVLDVQKWGRRDLFD